MPPKLGLNPYFLEILGQTFMKIHSKKHQIALFEKCVLLAQWLSWMTQGRCNPKVSSSIPAGGKGFP